MRYYPLFLDISRRRCVVIGGGSVAERKIERLLACGARVEVVGKMLTPALSALKANGRIVHHESDYNRTLIRGAFLVIGATDDGEVNGRISEDARELGILVNIVDQPARCDFILPSVVERGALSIAVSTGGNSPALAKKLRMELDSLYGPEYAILLEIMGKLREKLIAGGRSSAENRGRFEAVVASEILDHIRAKRWDEIEALILERTGIEMEVESR
ncbi:MAG: bifunctional precorrin-2 dehydrogenase/sirohydrochlorin ferrochelatase [Deltaproteobacteria bacterium]|nr:bifunctional precorrin-2 dehydrogenase/sirohydrochlorin ferrochelatase [Deltaproteobacteria bacterium]